jgi:uncharacterized protein (TIGR03067 family)
MRHAHFAGKVFFIGVVASAGIGVASANAEDHALQGYWKVVSLFRDGALAPSNDLYGGILIYDNKIVFGHLLADPRTLTYRTNRAKSPMHLDVFDEKGTELLMKAIFEIKKDDLRICIGEPRPPEFSTAKKDGRQLFVLHRETAKRKSRTRQPLTDARPRQQ